jgi:hypothetical protein
MASALIAPAAILGAAAIQGGTSLAGGKKGAAAATQASQLQYQAQLANLAQQRGILQTIQGDVQPFINYGTAGIAAADQGFGGLTQAIDTSLPRFQTPGPFPGTFTFQPTQAQLEQLPGYQFTLGQALKAGQNQLTASGLGRSQSAVNTAQNVASSLAFQTWPQLFNAELQQYNAALQQYTTNFNVAQQGYQTDVNSLLAGRTMDLQQRQQIYNMLQARMGVGLQSVGVGTGAAVPLAAQIGSAVTGAGAAQASGVVGAANAQIAGLQGLGQAAQTAAGGYTNFALINALQQQGSFNNPLASAAVNQQVDALATAQTSAANPYGPGTG